MVKPQTNSQARNDEFTKIFDEYRTKIEEITKKTAERNFQLFNEDSNNTADNDDEKPEETTAGGQPKPVNIRAEVERQANKEAAEIINEAKLKAQQLLIEAEENIKKEAKKKTQSQVDKIISKARKEAEDIMSRVRQVAEKERNEIITSSKQEAEQLIKDITEKCREETQAQSSQVITEAREEARKMINDIVTSSTEISKTATEIMDKAEKTTHEFENELQIELNELAKAIAEAQKKLEQVTTEAFERRETKVAPSNKNKNLNGNTVLSIQLIGEKSNDGHGSDSLFSGQVELKSVSSFDYRHLRNLVNYLSHVPSIKYIQECASEKEMSVLLDVQEPLPLLAILSDIPAVDEVIAEADGISLILKSHKDSVEKIQV